MKVQHFSIADLDIPQSHNGLQCEIFDNRGKGILKLHSKHIKNHDRFLRMATLHICQNNRITSTVVFLLNNILT
jgi:hypothetical protein